MSYYHGLISSRRANSLLNQRADGTFLIRDSQSQPGNYVLSAKYVGRMYHVLIFQQEGKYLLDSAGDAEAEECLQFSSLDELVLFLTGHNLKVGEDEVQLTGTCPCAQDATRMSSNSISKVRDDEDNDLLTDVFATLFGTRCVVICVAHSSASIDGQQMTEEKSYWVAIVKDLEQKGYFIRVVDKKERTLSREKKVGKQFQYDMPSDLLMTFLAEQGITCIGFRDVQEKDRFLHQIDRVVKLEQDRSIKLRGRKDSEAAAKQKPSQISHRIKASEFDVDNLSPEWQYLFDEAGVTSEMLRNKRSLQFILDTVYEIGPPQKLPTISSSGDGGSEVMERQQALALDESLKKTSMRASMLSDLLEEKELKPHTSSVERDNICSYLALCERFKDHLVIKHSMMALGPENGYCLCPTCGKDQKLTQMTGSPPQQYTLPLGWCQFMHSSQTHSLAQHCSKSWHVAYCCVPASRVANTMRTGQLVHSQLNGEVALTPDIQHACDISEHALVPYPPQRFHDKVTNKDYNVLTVFQVFVQPGTYTVHMAGGSGHGTGGNGHETGGEGGHMTAGDVRLEWLAKERTYIVQSLWIHMVAEH